MPFALVSTCSQQRPINFIVEGVPNDSLKYEMNFQTNEIIPDSVDGKVRKLNMILPFYYGYTYDYKSGDSDYLDCFIISEEFLERGIEETATVSGVILMSDNSEEDAKLLLTHGAVKMTNEMVNKVVIYLKTYSNDSIKIDSLVIGDVNYEELISSYSEHLNN